jgi:[ribosomal protein S5]-alanine N-acetyltransferase
MFRLETPRTFMREILGNDFDFLARMKSDPEVMRYYPRTYTERDVRHFIDRMRTHYREHDCGLWLVVDRESGAPLGRVGLQRQTVNGSEVFEIGYMIDRPYWRRGLATETASAVREYALGERGLSHVVSFIRPENIPSQGVARKLGMTPGEHITHAGFDHIVFQCSRGATAI